MFSSGQAMHGFSLANTGGITDKNSITVLGYQMLRTTNRNARRYHGLGGTPTYSSWYSMIERCGNPACISWRYYGAKGITVCKKWLDINGFVEDMGIRPDGLTLDRIDRLKNYEPSNCRWATELEQQRNRRGIKCSESMAKSIRSMVNNGVSQKHVAQIMSMSPSNVSYICSRKIWA